MPHEDRHSSNRLLGDDILHELVHTMPQLAWTARADGLIDWYNHRWYEYTGTTPEQMTGWGWKAVHHPDMVEAVSERWAAALATAQPFEMEFLLRGHDGVYRWFLTRGEPLHRDGKVVRWYGTNTLVEQQKRLSARIARLHEFAVALSLARSPQDVARAAVEQGAAALEADVSVFARMIDERNMEIVAERGLAPEAFTAHRFSLDARGPLAAAFKTGAPQFAESAEEFRRKFPDTARIDAAHGAVAALPVTIGTRVIGAFAFRFVAETSFGEEDRVLLRTLASQTAQAYDRAALFESEMLANQRMRALSELAVALAGATSIDAVVRTMVHEGMRATAADTSMLYDLDESGTHLRLIDEHGCPPEVVDRVRTIALTSEHGQMLQRELWIERNDEYAALMPEVVSIRTERPRARAFWNMPLVIEGRVIGVLAMGFHAPQRFTPETREFVRIFAQHCAQAVSRIERTSRLARAHADAEAANRAKDEFLAMLGHELRNPLTPISTALTLMDLRGLVGADRERAIIKRQVQHLTRLVDDLLDVSRITAGKIQLTKTRIELAEIVARAIETASPMFEQRNQHLSVAVPASGLIVDVDATRMAQAVANLLMNAAKYTDTKGRIHVSARQEASEVLLCVIDSGIGIEASMLPRVFDLFAQESQALDRARGGLGLGLSIVHSIVKMHGGAVSAHSEGKDKGSEFRIRLPLAAIAEAAVAERAPSAARPKPFVRARRVLVVDDNEDAAEMLCELVESMGHTTSKAIDGPSALRLLDEFDPSVALLDIGLPGMDGYELAERMRRSTRGHALRLVAVTGYGQNADRQRSLAAGFDFHLVKPVALDEIVRAVED